MPANQGSIVRKIRAYLIMIIRASNILDVYINYLQPPRWIKGTNLKLIHTTYKEVSYVSLKDKESNLWF